MSDGGLSDDDNARRSKARRDQMDDFGEDDNDEYGDQADPEAQAENEEDEEFFR